MRELMRAGSSRHAVMAGFHGWTFDAFDFFVVVFLLDVLSKEFGVPKKDIIGTLTATLAFRPIGAVVFGMLADRHAPLMVIELLSGFPHTYTQFLILRALFATGMGGEWGVGASPIGMGVSQSTLNIRHFSLPASFPVQAVPWPEAQLRHHRRDRPQRHARDCDPEQDA